MHAAVILDFEVETNEKRSTIQVGITLRTFGFPTFLLESERTNIDTQMSAFIICTNGLPYNPLCGTVLQRQRYQLSRHGGRIIERGPRWHIQAQLTASRCGF